MEGRVCLLERTLKRLGFVLMHDGEKAPVQRAQFKIKPACFVRKYRLKVDEGFVNTWAVFKYDERSQFADFEITSREPQRWGKQKIILEQGREGNGTKELVDRKVN